MPAQMSRLSIRHALARAALIALLPHPAPAAEPVKLHSGTPVLLELQHHITSAYTPAGSTIRFRVVEDIGGEGGIAISGGTPVEGRMRQTSDRARLGASGSMDFSVDFVTAVDGQQIRVIASESRRGRDRGNALAGWTIFWGLPGLMTRGVHGWLERGALIEALVLHDRRIGPAMPSTEVAVQASPASVRGRVASHRFSSSRADPYRLDFEREKPLGTVDFQLEPPPGIAPAISEPGAFRLVAIDGSAIDEAIPALSAREGVVTFDSWAVLRYCRHGATALRFSGPGPNAEPMQYEYVLNVAIDGRE